MKRTIEDFIVAGRRVQAVARMRMRKGEGRKSKVNGDKEKDTKERGEMGETICWRAP